MDILINNEIGNGGITADVLRKQLAGVGDEGVRIVINSAGGDCFEGIAIYNVIREFARNYKGTITTYIQGMAASASSWIALAPSSVSDKHKVIVEDNSVFMIHNCWGVVVGDRNAMRESADFAERVDVLMQKMLAKKSGKSEEEIGALMDAETWYFGDEIVKAGFADEIAKPKEEDDDEEESSEGEEEKETVETAPEEGEGKTEPKEEPTPEKEEEKEGPSEGEDDDDEKEKKKKEAVNLAKKRFADAMKNIKENAGGNITGVKYAYNLVKNASDALKARKTKEETQTELNGRLARAREIYSDCIGR